MVDKLTPLIDADVLRYEVGFGVEIKDEDSGEKVVKGFDSAISLLEAKVKEIEEEAWTTEPPIFFLTADEKMIDTLNKRRKKEGKKPKKFKPNFRHDIAITKGYKANRKGDKPTHYDNLTAYMLSAYKCKLAIGMEADDLLSIYQNTHKNTIICSRDKDLKITPGLHYGWACYRAPSYGPVEVTKVGSLTRNKAGKVSGTGLKFFYAQLLMGDTVDNIPGLSGKGPVYAYNLLRRCKTEAGLFKKVQEAYKENAGPLWREYFIEQANLLWIIQEVDKKGNPIHYKMLDER